MNVSWEAYQVPNRKVVGSNPFYSMLNGSGVKSMSNSISTLSLIAIPDCRVLLAKYNPVKMEHPTPSISPS